MGTAALCCETQILRDRYYIGDVCFNDDEYQGRHELLLPLELFHRVQQVMDEQSGYGGRQTGDHNLAKDETERRFARFQQGTFWIGIERTLMKRCNYNLVSLHARRKTFPAIADIVKVLASVWRWAEMAYPFYTMAFPALQRTGCETCSFGQ